MFEIYEKLRDMKGVKDGTVSAATNIPRSTFTDWRNGRSKPGPVKIEKLAQYFSVTTDFLMGRTEDVICPVCHQHYYPLNPYEFAEHTEYHDRFVKAQEMYGNIPMYQEVDNNREQAIKRFRDKKAETEKRIKAYQEYLKYDFLLKVYKSRFALNLDPEEYSVNEVEKLHPDYAVSTELINTIREKYGLAPLIEYQKTDTYYDNDETRELADFLKNNPEYRVLFDAARKVKPEDIGFVKDLIDRMKG